MPVVSNMKDQGKMRPRDRYEKEMEGRWQTSYFYRCRLMWDKCQVLYLRPKDTGNNKPVAIWQFLRSTAWIQESLSFRVLQDCLGSLHILFAQYNAILGQGLKMRGQKILYLGFSKSRQAWSVDQSSSCSRPATSRQEGQRRDAAKRCSL